MGPCPSRDIPTSLPNVRDTDCQSKNPPQCPKGTAAQSVCVAPVSHSQQGCLSLLGAHLLLREGESEHKVACVKPWTGGEHRLPMGVLHTQGDTVPGTLGIEQREGNYCETNHT